MKPSPKPKPKRKPNLEQDMARFLRRIVAKADRLGIPFSPSGMRDYSTAKRLIARDAKPKLGRWRLRNRNKGKKRGGK